MNNIVRWLCAAVAMALLFPVAACSSAGPLRVDGAYVRLSADRDNPASGYFTIHGGREDVSLRSVQTATALRIEIHDGAQQGGKPGKAIESVEVPAGTEVTFAPDGKRLLIWQINPQAIASGRIEFTMVFSNGERLLVDAVIEGPDGRPTGAGPTAR